ncbi:hypothetical protein B0T13DRAFT_391163, partial [Neurospora crassa]
KPLQIQRQLNQSSQLAVAIKPSHPATNPTASQDRPIKRREEPGCNRLTLFQTRKARKCREHLENSLSESRSHTLNKGTTAAQDMCSGCNGLRPRRAPGKTCWECFCKGQSQRWGVCDGCPAFWCPNRVVEEA